MVQTVESAANREHEYAEGLRRFYHPVALADELDRLGLDEHGQVRPLAKQLLGERIVLARLDGRVVALSGTCPHRGAGLDLGWVNAAGSALVCRYHGFEWAACGRLHRIPAIEADGHPLPAGPYWRVETYPTVVKYGLVWVCLDQQPRLEVLQVAAAEDDGFVTLPIAEQVWQAGCGRIAEAFMDTYHFPFAHWGSLGDPTHPEAPRASVELRDDCFRMAYSITQPTNETVTYGGSDGDSSGFTTSHYEGWAVPNAVHLIKTTGPVRFGIFAAICPLGPQLSKLYRILYVARGWAVDHEQLLQTQDRINAEDRQVVESCHPWELSTDLDAELQAYMDRPTVSFRKWLGRLGVHFM